MENLQVTNEEGIEVTIKEKNIINIINYNMPKPSVCQRQLFQHILDTVITFAQVGIEMDIDLVHELEQMYEYDDYTDATHEHMDLLDDVFDITNKTSEYIKAHENFANMIMAIKKKM